MSGFHMPVLCQTALDMLITSRDGTYVDATLGGGGHSEALLQMLQPAARVIGIDRDRESVATARSRLSDKPGFEAIQSRFSFLRAVLQERGIRQVDGILLDLGVSSWQLDHGPRGFSHRFESTLDMRMNQADGTSAMTVVNKWPERALSDALYTYGEEPRARRIAAAITRKRPVTTTTDLAGIVRAAVPRQQEAKTVARVFQAVRIAVNEELRELETVLLEARHVVATGGRLVVISYHSLEDRRVKRVMRAGNLKGEVVRDLYGRPLVPWHPLTKRPITACDKEVACNHRARSAKLRAAQRIRMLGSNNTSS